MHFCLENPHRNITAVLTKNITKNEEFCKTLKPFLYDQVTSGKKITVIEDK